MRRKFWTSFMHRGSSSSFALGIGFLAGGSLILYTLIVGGVFLAIGIGIFSYNWRHPIDERIPSMLDAIKNSKVVYGFWHTGVRAKQHFQYGSVTKILLLEPNPDSEAFKHILAEVTGKTTQNEILTEISLTKEKALSSHIKLRWHNEITSLSFMICDPSPNIKGELVKFSHKAFVIIQVLDRNLDIDEWSLYRKTNDKDKYAFNGYVNWFNEVWNNRSKDSLPREGLNETTEIE